MDDVYSFPSLNFLAAVGALTLNWASIEAGLDFATATIFHELRNDKMEPEIPRSLEKKIAFLRQSLRHPKLRQIGDESRSLLTDLNNSRQDRHGIVHGSVSGADQDGNAVHTLRIRYAKTRHLLSSETVTTAEVDAKVRKAEQLNERAAAFAIRVYNIARPEDLIDYPLGDFTG